ncbi:hypothetical protein [uncultured Campylobacter sp.]|nr:hypothetical protein [uncultured Campylobacter sp.]
MLLTPAKAVCLERSSIVAKPSEVGKNLKNQNFKIVQVCFVA